MLRKLKNINLIIVLASASSLSFAMEKENPYANVKLNPVAPEKIVISLETQYQAIAGIINQNKQKDPAHVAQVFYQNQIKEASYENTFRQGEGLDTLKKHLNCPSFAKQGQRLQELTETINNPLGAQYKQNLWQIIELAQKNSRISHGSQNGSPTKSETLLLGESFGPSEQESFLLKSILSSIARSNNSPGQEQPSESILITSGMNTPNNTFFTNSQFVNTQSPNINAFILPQEGTPVQSFLVEGSGGYDQNSNGSNPYNFKEMKESDIIPFSPASELPHEESRVASLLNKETQTDMKHEELDKILRENTELKANSDKLFTAVDELSRENEQQKERITSQEQTIEALEEKNIVLESNSLGILALVEKLRQEKEEKVQENEEIEASLTELENRLNQKEEKHEALLTYLIKEFQTKEDKLNKEIDEKDTIIGDLSSKNTELDTLNLELLNENKELQALVKKLQDQLKGE